MTPASSRKTSDPQFNVEPPRVSIARQAYRRIRAILALIGLCGVLYFPPFEVTQIISPSMAPTLQGHGETDGDWVLSEKISLRFRHARRWEVIGFVNDEGPSVMKRVVGLPGETVQIVGDQLLIDGRPMPIPASLNFLHYYAFGPQLHNGHIAACGDGYFVLGDDSKDSQDSRYEGPIATTRVHARPWLRIAPRSRIGFINP